MRRRQRGDRTPLSADVNVVSLIDLMMLLMVIFMITAPIMQGGVDLQLPKAEARAVESKDGMTISITRDGRIFVDQTQISLADFRASFKAMMSRKPNGGVYIRADRNARVQAFIEVVAIVKNAGVTNVAIVAEPEDVTK